MAAKEIDFPRLKDSFWRKTSDPDVQYNCIAFAVGRTDVYWWPDAYPDPDSDYWPAGIVREETVEAFVQLYESLGFAECPDGTVESGYEKIAIFAKGEEPTHASRQLENGHWTSKLGIEEDIEHDTLDAISGPCYGTPVRFMRRKRTVPDAG